MTKHVLVVDDESSVLEILTSWLTDAGYEISTADNGFNGLLQINQNPPDLVIADIIMPQMDGYELCRLTREFTAAPFMFLTGLSERESVAKGMSVGANDYLTKPVTNQELLEHVGGLLHGLRAATQGVIQVFHPRAVEVDDPETQ